jgi:hypothetical protein
MKSILRRVTLPLGAALFGALTCAGSAQAANDHCFYKGTMSSDGAMSCQTGAQFRCKDGDWKATGLPCTPEEKVAASKPCTFSGISYSTGAASCQNGTQFHCEDGAWTSLAVPCTVGDSPIRAATGDRTCMYAGPAAAPHRASHSDRESPLEVASGVESGPTGSVAVDVVTSPGGEHEHRPGMQARTMSGGRGSSP